MCLFECVHTACKVNRLFRWEVHFTAACLLALWELNPSSSFCADIVFSTSVADTQQAKALVRLPAQFQFLAYLDFNQIDFVCTAKKKKPWNPIFCQIKYKPHLEVVWNAIPIGFLHMHLSSDSLDAQIGFQSIFCVTPSVTHDDNIKSRVTGELEFMLLWTECQRTYAVWERYGGVLTWQHGKQQSVDRCQNK